MSSVRESSTAGSAINVVKFIKLMKLYPIPPKRQSKVEFDETWKLLEREMGIPRNLLARKWRNLVVTYRRELRSEMAAGPEYVSRWPHFQSMEFMRIDILSRMKTYSYGADGNAARKSTAIDVEETSAERSSIVEENDFLWEVMEQQALEQQAMDQPYGPELDSSTFDENNFPLPDWAFDDGKSSVCCPVYDFFMAFIYPLVAEMPHAAQLKVLEEMQQSVCGFLKKGEGFNGKRLPYMDVLGYRR